MPIVARQGWVIVGAFAAATLALAAAAVWLVGPAGYGLGGAGLLLTAWSVWFFRDPTRRLPADDRVVVSPADGVVSFVGPALPPAELGLDGDHSHAMTRVSVFMNIFNVHVNRSPARGRVTAVRYRPGRFFNASLDKASEHNERCSIALDLPDGRAMVVVQIAGLIARRIVCTVAPGRWLLPGERIGLIRFGSRVDVYLPAGVEPAVRPGQRMVGGETIVAHLGPAPTSPARPRGAAATGASVPQEA